MSAVEFSLPSPPPLLIAVPHVPLEPRQPELESFEKFYEVLSQLSRSIASTAPDALSRNLAALLRPIFGADFTNIVIFNESDGTIAWTSFGSDELATSGGPIVESTLWSVYQQQEALWVADRQRDERPAVRKEAEGQSTAGYRSLCRLPLRTAAGALGVLSFAGSRPHHHSPQEIRVLQLAADQVALALTNNLLRAELAKREDEIKEQLVSCENESLPDPLVQGIVGWSAALRRVLRQVEVVAPTDSGVLIQGETGTGKELIAQAIHERSARRGRPFVKVNCAAIPSGLLESELFGHEKGAFTGAVVRKPGRFEAADKGTLFLDEVGDIPLELQSKLLRVLQEHEFERLGSNHTQQADVRVIAATHRDLKQMVAAGTFRSDLYYRLHVFPVTVPSLRDRREDIPVLVRYFVDMYARRMNRRIENIPGRTMEALVNYPWPGNVRELQNFIERAVILSQGASLTAPLEELTHEPAKDVGTYLSTLEDMEREHILRALRESRWVTGGPGGAAAKLGMKRTTLAYRIRKLGILVRPE